MLLPFPSDNQLMILQDPFPSQAWQKRSQCELGGGKCLQWSALISTQFTLLVLMVKIRKEMGIKINEELWEGVVAMAFFTVDNESPGEQRARPCLLAALVFYM